MEEGVIKIVVTRERFEEIVSIDDSMNFLQITNKEAYDYMCQFVQNGTGTYLSTKEARAKFKRIARKEFQSYVDAFIKAVGEAYVNPPSGAESDGR